MNLTELIFKYIDGTITRQEDAIMRQMMEDDPSLKLEYTTLLNLDFEIKKDAKEIDYPEEFFDNIENEIKTKIYKDNQITYSTNRFTKSRNFATTLAIMLILIISNIGNPWNDFSNIKRNMNNSQISENLRNYEHNTNTTSDIFQNTRHKISKRNNNEKIASVYSSSSIANQYSQIPVQENNSENQIAAQIELMDDAQFAQYIQSKELTLSNTLLANDLFQQSLLNYNQSQSNTSSKNFNQNIAYTFPQFTNSQQVELNSFFGSDIASFGVNKSSSTITSFTQSIAYDLNPKTKIGIETGYLQVEVDKEKYLEIKPGTLDEFGSTVNSDGSSLLIRTPGKENFEQKIIWAGIFYERNLIEFNDITLSSRVGAGLSDNGFIGNVKLIAMYRLSKSINFTVGGETKLFSGQNEYLNSNNKLNSTISLIYGVHFGF